jgi:uncharacterized protein YjbI with pentapeptide repeats
LDFSGSTITAFRVDLDRHIPDAVGLGTDGLWEANLGGANLSDANLMRERLYNTDLTGAVLTKASLHHADLTRALGLTQAQIDSAEGDAATKLPGNLIMPLRWKTASRPLVFSDRPSGGGVHP